LKRVWHEYRPCAHLWAALLQWKEQKGGARLIPTDGKDLHAFLALAESLRIKGGTFRHKQAKEALLPDEVAWRLSGQFIVVQWASELGSKF
jgi:hypothetical protein